METWILPALLGVGLAAATGFRTFLPLLGLGLAAKFQLFGMQLADAMSWLDSTPALIALGLATVIELAADKIPAVDHALSAVGTIIRPIAGAVAAGAAFSNFDPMVAAIAGLIIGAPTALAFHAAQAGTRVVSTSTTLGLANPFISVGEDIAAIFTTLLAMLAPVLIPLLLAVMLLALWSLWRFVRRGRQPTA
ncbi:DUF4126 domain-containing protein [Caulobacter sp. NIBR1757]|uniref:DUF4126 domain-containing protein n=1 Tax=Caulobacter sp. NIBR1757 TaxID=3016000 RepID=UPI0022F0D859|nr:DUF4126 domain-containing protein [Caulobacter sp. NIBR1757]WGM38157.1 hypothetical protein AMEJIAPC_01059 [Caulobacter sp. NIBR1757]